MCRSALTAVHPTTQAVATAEYSAQLDHRALAIGRVKFMASSCLLRGLLYYGGQRACTAVMLQALSPRHTCALARRTCRCNMPQAHACGDLDKAPEKTITWCDMVACVKQCAVSRTQTWQCTDRTSTNMCLNLLWRICDRALRPHARMHSCMQMCIPDVAHAEERLERLFGTKTSK